MKCLFVIDGAKLQSFLRIGFQNTVIGCNYSVKMRETAVWEEKKINN